MLHIDMQSDTVTLFALYQGGVHVYAIYVIIPTHASLLLEPPGHCDCVVELAWPHQLQTGIYRVNDICKLASIELMIFLMFHDGIIIL